MDRTRPKQPYTRIHPPETTFLGLLDGPETTERGRRVASRRGGHDAPVPTAKCECFEFGIVTGDGRPCCPPAHPRWSARCGHALCSERPPTAVLAVVNGRHDGQPRWAFLSLSPHHTAATRRRPRLSPFTRAPSAFRSGTVAWSGHPSPFPSLCTSPDVHCILT
jgi:hypothetical protein